MKTYTQNSLRIISMGVCIALSLLAHNAEAGLDTWDPQGASGNATGGTWENASWDTANQTGTATPVHFVEGDAANFSFGNLGGSASTYTITMGANHTVAGIFNGPLTPKSCFVTLSGSGHIVLPTTGPQGFDTAGSTLGQTTISVVIDGPSTCALETEGGGGLILNGNNTYSGGTLIDGGGGISFGNNNAFGTGTVTWLVDGFIQPATTAAFNIPNAMQHTNGIETYGGNTSGVTFSGNWALPTAGTLALENIAGTITVSGVISGTTGLTLTNKGGTWTLSGVNTFTGTVTNGGTLTIGGAGQLGSGTFAGNIVDLTNLIYSSSAAQTFSGVISGAGKYTQNSGTVTMSGANTYTGGNTLAGGVVVLNKAEVAGTSGPLGKSADANPGFIVMSGGTLRYTAANNQHDYSGRFSTAASQQYNVDVNGATVIYASPLASSGGTLTVSSTAGGGTLTLSATNSYTGQTTVTGATLNLNNSGGLDAVLGTAPGSPVTNQLVLNNATLESSQTITLSANRGITVTGANTITNNGKDLILPQNIGGSGSVTKTGANATVLGGSNSFSGLTLLQGTTYLVTNYSAGSGNLILGPTIGLVTMRVTNTAPLQTSITIANNITVNAGGTKIIDMVVAGGDTLTFSGQISGTGGLVRGNGGGPGNVALTGSNTNWSGGIALEQGGLIVGNTNALGTGLLAIQPTGSGGNAVDLQAGTALTGVNAITNSVQIAVSNATDQITIGGANGLELAGPVTLAQTGSLAPVITNNNSGGTIISGVISAGLAGTGLTCVSTNGSVLTLNATDTYDGNTTIASGTLAIGASGSINNSPLISIGAGGTFDVSAIAAYTISGSTALSASGTATPATINGASGGTVSLGSQPITLTYDGVDPALTISQGTLVLSGNAFTVNGAFLPAGTYTLIQQASGSITSSGSYTVSGTAIRPGTLASIVVTGGSVNLVIQLETPAFTGISSTSVTYGTPTVTLSGTLGATVPATLYPSNGETVTVTINGNSQNTTINDTNGDFSINYNCAGLIYSTVPYTITYAYAGSVVLNPTTNTSTTLTVVAPTAPGITNNPTAQMACSGSPATFSVGASGTNDTYAWYKHANAGWGSAWSASGGGGTFLASSTGNDNGDPSCNTFSSFGDINTPSGNSWGIYGGGAGESVIRTFPVALTNSQVFQVDMDNGGVANGVQNGFALQNSTGGFLFSFYFQGGGTQYAFSDANGNTTTTVPFTVTGLRIQLIMGSGSPAAYSLLITPCGGSTVEYSGTFATTNGPGQVVLFNNNPYGGGANDLYFNSMFAGSACDNADNYTNGGWNSVDAGDDTPIAGATNATYTTSSGSNGDLYYAIVANGGGYAASSTAQLTVNPLPTVTVNSATTCAGDSVMLTATTSASSPIYLWSPGGSTNSSITVSPASNTTYTVMVTDGVTGCGNSGSGTVTVNPLPTVSVNSATTCVGGSVMLTATTSANNPTYLWSDSETNASITVTPGSTTIYTVTVTDGVTGCTNNGSGTVTVNPLPTVSVNSATTCVGGSAMLTATTSASNPIYLWSPGGSTNSSIIVSPVSTTTYTVMVTDGVTGCMNSGSGTVTVNPLPTVSVNSASVCAGGAAMLTATTSASNPIYLWSPGGSTNSSITVSPTSNTTYMVTVTDGVTGCMNSGSGTVTVNPLPTVSVNSASVCSGGSVMLTATTSASNPSYLWSPGGSTNSSITVSPATTTNYSVMVTDGTTGCMNSASGTVTVNPLPTVSVNSASVCAGGSVMLTATTSASSPTYLWSDSETTASITVSPSSTTNYTVLVTDGTTGCTNSASGTVTVNPLPTITLDSTAISVNYGSTNAGLSYSGTTGSPDGYTLTYDATAQAAGFSNVTLTALPASPITLVIPPIAADTNIYNGTLTVNYSTTGCSSSNYDFTVTVVPLPVNLTGTRPYDGATDADSSILTIANDLDGINLTLSGSAVLAGSGAGTQLISDFSGLALGGTAATNYTLASASGSVVVTTVPISITSYSTNKTYGTAITLDPTAFTVGGTLVGSETVTAVMQTSGGTAAGAPVSGSPYPITPSAATGINGFLATNYNITYNAGALTVNPLSAVLAGTRPYDGTAAAPFGILSVANVVGSDDVNVASGSGTLASAAVGTNNIASFGSLALGGTTAPDYTLSGASGSVIVTNPHTPFDITSSTFDHVGTNIVIVYQSVPGVVYQVLSSPNVSAPLNTWTNEGSAVTAVGTLTTNVIPTDTNVIKVYIVKDVQ